MSNELLPVKLTVRGRIIQEMHERMVAIHQKRTKFRREVQLLDAEWDALKEAYDFLEARRREESPDD